MARELKYPVRHYVRISEETDRLLSERAQVMGLKVSEVLRIIVEHSLNGKPIKEGSNVNTRQTQKK